MPACVATFPNAPDMTYARRGAFLKPSSFNPLEFGVPPSIVPATDSAQILALIVAQRVLNDAADGQFEKMEPVFNELTASIAFVDSVEQTGLEHGQDNPE